MDLIMVFSGFFVIFIGGLIGGFVSRIIFDTYFGSKIERELMSIRNKIASPLGVNARAEYSAEQSERLALATSDYLTLKEQGLSNSEILKELAPKYMDLVPLLLKQFGGKNALKSITSFLN